MASRASEYARAVTEIKGSLKSPTCTIRTKGDPDVFLCVLDDGRLGVSVGSGSRFIEPDDALAIGRWLVTTFGEPEEVKPNG